MVVMVAMIVMIGYYKTTIRAPMACLGSERSKSLTQRTTCKDLWPPNKAYSFSPKDQVRLRLYGRFKPSHMRMQRLSLDPFNKLRQPTLAKSSLIVTKMNWAQDSTTIRQLPMGNGAVNGRLM